VPVAWSPRTRGTLLERALYGVPRKSQRLSAMIFQHHPRIFAYDYFSLISTLFRRKREKQNNHYRITCLSFEEGCTLNDPCRAGSLH
jgi:hypothetical protein